jgi:hypothetical protein
VVFNVSVNARSSEDCRINTQSVGCPHLSNYDILCADNDTRGEVDMHGYSCKFKFFNVEAVLLALAVVNQSSVYGQSDEHPKSKPKRSLAGYIVPMVGLGVGPTNSSGGLAGLQVNDFAAIEMGASYSGSRTEALGNALVFGARYALKDRSVERPFLAFHIARYAGSARRTVAFSKKIGDYRPGGGSCDPAECESYNTALLHARWAYYYADIGGGMEWTVNGSKNIKVIASAGIGYCFSESLNVNDGYDQRLGSPMGIEINKESLLSGNQAIVKKGDFGPFVNLGLMFEIPI